jgi:hypothetical protein
MFFPVYGFACPLRQDDFHPRLRISLKSEYYQLIDNQYFMIRFKIFVSQ